MSVTQPPAAGPVPLAWPFPPAPPQVRQALNTFAALRAGDASVLGEFGDIGDLPRPWDPPTCPPEMRRQLWRWCDQVAGWVNRTYTWRPGQLIPGCWPQHPHLTHELALLACLRDAADTISPEPLEQWHRSTLPLFLDRLATRLGEGTCRVGTHQDWPAAARYDATQAPAAAHQRADHIDADTH